MINIEELTRYPDSYEQSRERFRKRAETLKPLWPNVSLRSISVADGLNMDVLRAEAARPDNVLIVTTGLHGVEGYVGSAMLELLLDEYVAKLDHARTSVVLVHAINAWGMANFRKANAGNIDLNRNFVADWSDPAARGNPLYDQMKRLFRPHRHFNKPWLEKLRFYCTLLRELRVYKPAQIARAATLGQYGDAQGTYYGGTAHEPVTRELMALYDECLGTYKQVVHLDMHTGYGPRDRMVIVNSPLERRSRAELRDLLSYAWLNEADEAEFYAIHGDMIDYVYCLQAAHPHTKLFATTLEFGTLGDSLAAQLESLHVTIQENDHFHTGRGHPENIRRRYGELYYPTSEAWRAKALADCRQAYDGVIRGFRL